MSRWVQAAPYVRSSPEFYIEQHGGEFSLFRPAVNAKSSKVKFTIVKLTKIVSETCWLANIKTVPVDHLLPHFFALRESYP